MLPSRSRPVSWIIKRAKELGDEHHRVAQRAAAALKDATATWPRTSRGYSAGSGTASPARSARWATGAHDHLDAIHSVLSTISAVAGLVALLTLWVPKLGHRC